MNRLERGGICGGGERRKVGVVRWGVACGCGLGGEGGTVVLCCAVVLCCMYCRVVVVSTVV